MVFVVAAALLRAQVVWLLVIVEWACVEPLVYWQAFVEFLMALNLRLVRQVALRADGELLDARPQQALRRMLRLHLPLAQVVIVVLELPDDPLRQLVLPQTLPV